MNSNYFLNNFIEVHIEKDFYIVKNIKSLRYYKINKYDYLVLEDFINGTAFAYSYTSNDEKRKKAQLQAMKILDDTPRNLTRKEKLCFTVKLPEKLINDTLHQLNDKLSAILYNNVFIAFNFMLSIFFLLVILLNYSFTFSLNSKSFYIILWFIINIILHELSHALACYYCNRKPFDFGIKIYFFCPTFYVNTTDMLMSKKFDRYLVSFAGIHFNLILGNIMSIFILITSINSKSINSLVIMALISYLFAFFNLLPLYKLDGFYMVSDLLNIYNLYEFSKKRVKSILLTKKIESKKDIVIIIYFLFTFLFKLLASILCLYSLLRIIF